MKPDKSIMYAKTNHEAGDRNRRAAALVRVKGVIFWRYRGPMKNLEYITLDFTEDSFTEPEQVITYVSLLNSTADIPREIIQNHRQQLSRRIQ